MDSLEATRQRLDVLRASMERAFCIAALALFVGVPVLVTTCIYYPVWSQWPLVRVPINFARALVGRAPLPKE
jgi:hypothetical protein